MAMPILQWTRQIGSSDNDDILSMATDPSGNVFVGGYTKGKLTVASEESGMDAFVAKYNSRGKQLWLKQFSLGEIGHLKTIVADANGNLYLGGLNSDRAAQIPALEENNIAIIKLSPQGTHLWGMQFGHDAPKSITHLIINPDKHIYIAGSKAADLNKMPNALGPDIFLAKYDLQGALLWTRQFGSANSDRTQAICSDSIGNVYVGGYTEGTLGEEPNQGRLDIFLAKYNSKGEQNWLKQLGSNDTEMINALATDQRGDIYIGGLTAGELGEEPNQRWDDAFLAKYSSQGDQLWLKQLGTNNFEGVKSVTTDALGFIYIGGYTRGQLGDGPKLGAYDAFLAKYDVEGTQLWLHQFGTSENEGIQTLARDHNGNIYAAGYTFGQMGSDDSMGERDAFIAKYFDEAAITIPPKPNIPMQRPTINQLLEVQVYTVLDFLNKAQTVEDLTNIEKYRPDLSKEALASYSIGEQSAKNILEARANLRAKLFNTLDEVLAVKGVGEDKVLDIVEFIWQPTEEIFRKELFDKVLGENWAVNYWRYSLDAEEFKRLEEEEVLLKSFIGKKVLEITQSRNDNNYLTGALAKALLEKSPLDRVEGGNARVQFASWWYRFDEDNWFSFERISEVIEPFINSYGKKKATYIDLVFFRGFMNGPVAGGISPDDLVVSLNPSENAITIWGISLFD